MRFLDVISICCMQIGGVQDSKDEMKLFSLYLGIHPLKLHKASSNLRMEPANRISQIQTSTSSELATKFKLPLSLPQIHHYPTPCLPTSCHLAPPPPCIHSHRSFVPTTPVPSHPTPHSPSHPIYIQYASSRSRCPNTNQKARGPQRTREKPGRRSAQHAVRGKLSWSWTGRSSHGSVGEERCRGTHASHTEGSRTSGCELESRITKLLEDSLATGLCISSLLGRAVLILPGILPHLGLGHARTRDRKGSKLILAKTRREMH